MKILFVNDYAGYFGGVEQSIADSVRNTASTVQRLGKEFDLAGQKFLRDLQLCLHRQMRIIQHDRIFRLPQRTDLPMRVDIIPLSQILLHFFQRNIGVLFI